jgi:hypothetical protein
MWNIFFSISTAADAVYGIHAPRSVNIAVTSRIIHHLYTSSCILRRQQRRRRHVYDRQGTLPGTCLQMATTAHVNNINDF